jgi:hypothetical protein
MFQIVPFTYIFPILLAFFNLHLNIAFFPILNSRIFKNFLFNLRILIENIFFWILAN